MPNYIAYIGGQVKKEQRGENILALGRHADDRYKMGVAKTPRQVLDDPLAVFSMGKVEVERVYIGVGNDFFGDHFQNPPDAQNADLALLHPLTLTLPQMQFPVHINLKPNEPEDAKRVLIVSGVKKALAPFLCRLFDEETIGITGVYAINGMSVLRVYAGLDFQNAERAVRLANEVAAGTKRLKDLDDLLLQK